MYRLLDIQGNASSLALHYAKTRVGLERSSFLRLQVPVKGATAGTLSWPNIG